MNKSLEKICGVINNTKFIFGAAFMGRLIDMGISFHSINKVSDLYIEQNQTCVNMMETFGPAAGLLNSNLISCGAWFLGSYILTNESSYVSISNKKINSGDVLLLPMIAISYSAIFNNLLQYFSM
jgi:hypothetical protein